MTYTPWNETILEVVGVMDFRGERLRVSEYGEEVSAPVRLTWTQELEEIRSVMDEIYDRLPSRLPTSSVATLTAPDVRVLPAITPVWAAQPWEPFTFTYLSDQGWISTTATCTIISADPRHGTEWRIHPSDYIPNGLTFKRDLTSTHPDLTKGHS